MISKEEDTHYFTGFSLSPTAAFMIFTRIYRHFYMKKLVSLNFYFKVVFY